MNSDYNLMGLFSKLRKKKEDSDEVGRNTYLLKMISIDRINCFDSLLTIVK